MKILKGWNNAKKRYILLLFRNIGYKHKNSSLGHFLKSILKRKNVLWNFWQTLPQKNLPTTTNHSCYWNSHARNIIRFILVAIISQTFLEIFYNEIWVCIRHFSSETNQKLKDFKNIWKPLRCCPNTDGIIF